MNLKIMPRAKIQTSELLIYLLQEFGQKTRNEFKELFYEVLDTIPLHPLAFPVLKENIHRAVVSKQTTIIYRVNSERDRIEVLSVFDTRQHPEKLMKNL